MIALLFASAAFAGAVCKDGWRSPSEGTGTCSHHGGVAYWEHDRSLGEGCVRPPFVDPTNYALAYCATAHPTHYRIYKNGVYVGETRDPYDALRVMMVDPVFLAHVESQDTAWVGGPDGARFRKGLDDTSARAFYDYISYLRRGEVPPEDHEGRTVYYMVKDFGAYQRYEATVFDIEWVLLRRRITILEARAKVYDPLRQGRDEHPQTAPTPSAREAPTASQVREVVVERAKTYPKDDTGKPIPGGGPAYTAALTYAEDTFGVGGKSSVDALLYWTRRVAESEAEAQDAAAYGLAVHLYMHKHKGQSTP